MTHEISNLHEVIDAMPLAQDQRQPMAAYLELVGQLAEEFERGADGPDAKTEVSVTMDSGAKVYVHVGFEWEAR